MGIHRKVSGHPPLPYQDLLPPPVRVLWALISPATSRQQRTTSWDTRPRAHKRPPLHIKWQ